MVIHVSRLSSGLKLTVSLHCFAGGNLPGTDLNRPLLGSAADPLHPHSLTLLAGLKPSNPKLQKAVWQDLIREDDARQMDALIAKLDMMRAQKPPEARPSKPVKKEQSGERRVLCHDSLLWRAEIDFFVEHHRNHLPQKQCHNPLLWRAEIASFVKQHHTHCPQKQ